MLNILSKVHTAAADYVADKVSIDILYIEPAFGETINPGENFTFSIGATNVSKKDGGVRLTNVIWHVWVGLQTSSPTFLAVPDSPLDVREDLDLGLPLLTPGQLVTDMFIFPQTGRSVLDVGETNRLDLSGRGTSSLSGGLAQINFEIFATVDLASIFPQSQSDSPATEAIEVVG